MSTMINALLDHAAESARAGCVPPSTVAFGSLGLGDWVAAFGWLDRTIEGRDPLVMPIKS